MAVSPLREITIGVQDLRGRTAQFADACGLTVLGSGPLTAMTAGRLFDSHLRPQAARLARTDVQGSTVVRLVEVPSSATIGRSQGVGAPGPLGVGFTTDDVIGIHRRLEERGARFPFPSTVLPGMDGVSTLDAERLEMLASTDDGDFIMVSERRNASPYGAIKDGCSEPLHASFVVTNLEACLHFMSDVLDHHSLRPTSCAGVAFESVFGLTTGASFRFASPDPPGSTTGRLNFIEFETRLQPMIQTHALSRGLCRLRYDALDLHETLSRVPGGGGSLVRGPASVDDPVLGAGLVAMVRAPFGVLIELWQTR